MKADKSVKTFCFIRNVLPRNFFFLEYPDVIHKYVRIEWKLYLTVEPIAVCILIVYLSERLI